MFLGLIQLIIYRIVPYHPFAGYVCIKSASTCILHNKHHIDSFLHLSFCRSRHIHKWSYIRTCIIPILPSLHDLDHSSRVTVARCHDADNGWRNTRRSNPHHRSCWGSTRANSSYHRCYLPWGMASPLHLFGSTKWKMVTKNGHTLNMQNYAELCRIMQVISRNVFLK